jgi:hypothetical protein
MELLDQTEQYLKKVSYTVKHNDKEYTLTDFFEHGESRIIHFKIKGYQHLILNGYAEQFTDEEALLLFLF